VVSTVKIAVTKPSFVDALVNQRARELVAAATAAWHVRMVAAVLVGHVQAVVVAVASPRRLHAPTVRAREL